MRTRIGIGILTAALALGGLATPALAEAHELSLENGATWRGDDGDRVKVVFEEQGVQQEMTGVVESIQGRSGFEIVIVRGMIAGQERKKGIFAPDIVSMTTVDSGAGRPGSRSCSSVSSSSKGTRFRKAST